MALSEMLSTDILDELVQRAEYVQDKLLAASNQPDNKRSLKRTFSAAQLSSLLGYTNTSSISKHIANGNIEKKQKYDFDDISNIRNKLNRNLKIDETKKPLIVAVANYKGGVGKTTTTVHAATNLAMNGLKVLLIDGDGQASLTCNFGYVPDVDIEDEDTLAAFLHDEEPTLDGAIRKTQWKGLDLIPASMALYSAELWLQNKTSIIGRKAYKKLGDGLQAIKKDYDVIIIDTPPSLGGISMNIIGCADAFIIPTSPGMYDYFSTVQFITMLNELQKELGKEKIAFAKLLITRYDDISSNSTQTETIQNIFINTFGDLIYKNTFKKTSLIVDCQRQLKSAYEINRSDVTASTYNRGIKIIDAVCNEIREDIMKFIEDKD